MTDTTDIEALVAELRGLAGSSILKALAHTFTDAADALERQQAVVEAIKPFAECADFIDTHSRHMNDESGLWTPFSSKGPQPPCIRVSHVRAARDALAALDAPPEGDKP